MSRKTVRRSASARSPLSIVLRSVFSGAPGMSSALRLEIRRLPDRTEIWGRTDDDNEPEVLAEVEGPFDVLEVARALLNAQIAVTDSLSEEISVRGAHGTAAEILKLAAIENEDARGVAAMLVTATLPQLDALNTDAGPVGEADFILRAAAAANAWSEIDQPPLATFPDLAADALTLERLEEILSAEQLRQEETLERGRAARERALAPFRQRIDAFVEHWLRVYGTRGPLGIGYAIQGGALRSFMESHVLHHGTLPTGRHEITYALSVGITPPNLSVMRVDFDVPLSA